MRAILFVLTIVMFVSTTMEAQKQKRRTKNYYLTDAKSSNEIAQIDNKLEKVVNLFTGHFASMDSDNLIADQELIGRRIWQKRSGEAWVYLGWFKAGFIESPISMSICKFSRVSPDTILMETFDFPNKESYVEEWMEKEPFNNLEPGDLISKGNNCGTYLTRNSENEFRMFPKGLCHTPLNASIEYSMSEGMLDLEAVNMITRFYGKEKDLLLESDTKYVRLDKDKPKY